MWPFFLGTLRPPLPTMPNRHTGSDDAREKRDLSTAGKSRAFESMTLSFVGGPFGTSVASGSFPESCVKKTLLPPFLSILFRDLLEDASSFCSASSTAAANSTLAEVPSRGLADTSLSRQRSTAVRRALGIGYLSKASSTKRHTSAAAPRFSLPCRSCTLASFDADRTRARDDAAPADAARLPKSPPGVSNVPKSSSSLAGVLGGVRNLGESTLLDPSGKVLDARVPVLEAGDDVRSGEWDDGALLV